MSGGQKILPPNLSQELGVEVGPGPLPAQLGDPGVPAHRSGTRNRAELEVHPAGAGELRDGKGRPSQQNDICGTRVGKKLSNVPHTFNLSTGKLKACDLCDSKVSIIYIVRSKLHSEALLA